MTTIAAESPASSETATIVLKALATSPEPLTAPQVAKTLTGPFRVKTDELQRILDALVEQRRIHRLPPYRGKDRYWTRTLDDYARGRIRLALDRRPLTRSELKASLKAALRGVAEKRQGELLRELEQQGEIRKLPPLIGSRTDRFSTRPADPREYVEHALGKLAEKLAKVGIDERQLRAACREALDGRTSRDAEEAAATSGGRIETAGPAVEAAAAPSTPSAPAAGAAGERFAPAATDDELARLVIERMKSIEIDTHGSIVSVTELRRRLQSAGMDKLTFDRILLDLGRRERVILHRHDYAASLREEERDQLISDDRGRYYNGVSLKVES